MNELPAVDVAVIGGGVIGCSCAYQLAKRGVSVALLEAQEIASAASGASAGGVRQQGRDLRETPIAIRAIELWPGLPDELGADLDYHQDGHITLVERPEDLAVLRERVEAERALGLDIWIVDRRELDELAPGLGAEVIAGSWCPTDGHANPILTTKAFARRAGQLGAKIYERTSVTGIELDGQQVAAIETTKGRLPCRWAINAAGAWSPAIGRLVGIELPIETQALQMLLTTPMPAQLRPVLVCVGKKLSLKQLANGCYLIGGSWPGDVHQERRFGANRFSSICGSADHASSVYPVLRNCLLLRAWTGLEAIAIDEVPILGPVPGVDGFLLACGFSGHGFALSPYIGVLIADCITAGQPSLPLEPLAFERDYQVAR